MKKYFALLTLSPFFAYADEMTDAATAGLSSLSATVTTLGTIAIGIAVAFAVARIARKAVNKV